MGQTSDCLNDNTGDGQSVKAMRHFPLSNNSLFYVADWVFFFILPMMSQYSLTNSLNQIGLQSLLT